MIGTMGQKIGVEAQGARQNPSVSVVVPVFNSAPILRHLVDRLEAALVGVTDEYEVLLVNDGSRDASWETIRELCQRSPRLRGVNLARNFGQHNATLAGIRLARHQVIVTIDDDLQQPPEEIPSLLAKLGEGFDVVYGTPEHDEHAKPRAWAARATKLVLEKAIGITRATDISSFRAFRAELRVAFAQFAGEWVSIDVLLSWGAGRYAAVPVKHFARLEGASNYTLGKLILHVVNMLTGFSVLPLRIASIAGLVAALFGFAVLVYVVARYLSGGAAVPGFTFLASLISILAGVQLLALGVLGEYVARMHYRVMGRPPYVVGAIVHSGDPDSESGAD
jgi:undecaprenyl-phosphate 4-deoxy-4-formamido-L-arabinose transferase